MGRPLTWKHVFAGIILALILSGTGQAASETSSNTPATSDMEESLGDDFSDTADLGDDFSEGAGLGDDFSEDLGDDFSDSIDSDTDTLFTDADSPPPFIAFTGHLQFTGIGTIAHDAPKAGETDWRGISSLETELYLEAEKDLTQSITLLVSGNTFYDAAYSLNIGKNTDRDDYTSEVLDDYEADTELRKAYLEARINSYLDIKAGRQIEVWGKSDNLRITDVLNPIDMQTPGLTDLEDLRLPIAMTKFDFYFGNWNISAIAVHEHTYNKLPEYGSDFYALPVKSPAETHPSHTIENTETALAVNGTFSGWDLSLYYAHVYNDMPFLNLKGFTGTPPAVIPQYELTHAPLDMAGAAVNIAHGNFLYKTEAALLDGLRLNETATNIPKKYTRIDALAGIEYTGFTDTTVSVETAVRHMTHTDDATDTNGIEENRMESAIRITRDFFHDTLTLTALGMIYGEKAQDGAIYRLTLDYDLNDAIVLTGGGVAYKKGERFPHIGDNDRLYCQVKYSF